MARLAVEPELPDRSTDLRATGERIDALLNASAVGGPVARERAEELVRLVTDLYGAGLERFMDVLHEAGHLDADLLAVLAQDDLLGSLLLVHGLHPYSVETRVEQALESVRPYLGSHGGDVELLAVTEEGTVQLRLLGSCDGCPSSSVTLRLAVEDAIESAAPEITAITVKTPASARAEALIPAASLTAHLHRPSTGDRVEAHAGWHPLPDLDNLADGAVTTVVAGNSTILVCRIGTTLFGFDDRCGRCERSLAGAVLSRRLGGAVGDGVLRCPSCQAHYDVRRAGVCADVPGVHLTPLPLLADGDGFTVAVPSPAVAG